VSSATYPAGDDESHLTSFGAMHREGSKEMERAASNDSILMVDIWPADGGPFLNPLIGVPPCIGGSGALDNPSHDPNSLTSAAG
jgi:hypothetical protein